jgi:CheY-like chemotaxis protein
VLVALTGYGQSEDVAQSREAGFVAHLVKPVSPERLEAVFQLAYRNQLESAATPGRRFG